VLFGMVSLCSDRSCGHDLSKAAGHNITLPIDGRAWTLQESWLSARLLIYGEGPLQWKCLSSAKIDGYEFDSTPQLLTQLEIQLGMGRHQFFPQRDNIADGTFRVRGITLQSVLSNTQLLPMEQNLIKIWKSLVENFSNRELTESADKLPALSGITAEFHRISHDDFYAGLWKSRMAEQLLWHHTSDDPPRGLPRGFRAPSWSWAAVDGAISFSVSASVSFSNDSSTIPKSDKVIVHGCTTTVVKPVEPFGEVDTGELLLSAPASQMSWEEVKCRFDIYVEGTPSNFTDYIILDGGAASPLFPLFRADMSLTMSQKTFCGPQSFWFLEMTRERGPAGLVLVASKGRSYRRVAYFRLGSREVLKNQAIEYDLGGGAHKKPRDWDWENSLSVRTMRIV
jgi:hypothetical protein